MKTKKLICLLPLAMAAAGVLSPAAFAGVGLTVHEWGTFTSVQGGDGKLLSWRPLKTSELPGFVYDWTKPGLNRRFAGFFAGGEPFQGKGMMITLQRLETPVIYFYADKGMSVDVSVDFPKGLITEWYPQATLIGPSLVASTNESASFATLENRAVWKNLLVTPSRQLLKDKPLLPRDGTGSHYYTARDAGSDWVRTTPVGPNDASEAEKFVFYRGVGNFKTPLRVSMDTNGVVAVENTSAEDLQHLFLLSVHDGYGAFEAMQSLPTGKLVRCAALGSVAMDGPGLKRFPLEEFQHQIAAQMEAALVAEGLFPPEARAMVNTWKDSWFTEEGERVLYLLPRAWTDETLPIHFAPQPETLVRVMVGRAEIISPHTQVELADTLTKAAAGDTAARSEAVRQLRKLGRFAEPVLLLANVQNKSNPLELYGFDLLPEAAAVTLTQK